MKKKSHFDTSEVIWKYYKNANIGMFIALKKIDQMQCEFHLLAVVIFYWLNDPEKFILLKYSSGVPLVPSVILPHC